MDDWSSVPARQTGRTLKRRDRCLPTPVWITRKLCRPLWLPRKPCANHPARASQPSQVVNPRSKRLNAHCGKPPSLCASAVAKRVNDAPKKMRLDEPYARHIARSGAARHRLVTGEPCAHNVKPKCYSASQKMRPGVTSANSIGNGVRACHWSASGLRFWSSRIIARANVWVYRCSARVQK